MKRFLIAVLVFAPAQAFAREEEPRSALEQLREEAGPEHAPARIPDSVGRAIPMPRHQPVPPPDVAGQGRLHGSGNYSPMDGHLGGAMMRVSGDIPVVRASDGATALVRVTGELHVPGEARHGDRAEARVSGFAVLRKDGQVVGMARIAQTVPVTLSISGTYVSIDGDVRVSGRTENHEPFNCEEDPPSAPSSRHPE